MVVYILLYMYAQLCILTEFYQQFNGLQGLTINETVYQVNILTIQKKCYQMFHYVAYNTYCKTNVVK